jgi:tetratricopeptide (TPR) repeat protein
MVIEDLIRCGERHYIDGNLQEAKNCFSSVINTQPYHLEAHNNLGVILFNEGQTDPAQDIFKKILAIDPAYKDALMNLFNVFNKLGEDTRIIPYIEKAKATAPMDRELEIFLKDVKNQICPENNQAVPSDILNAEAFFVLSCGRCGSKTLNEVLNTAENARSFHSPQPGLGQWALDAFWKRIDKKDFIANYRYPLIGQTSNEGFVFGETTPAITAFSDVLAEAIPKAKFVILVRDPMTFTRSALFQKFYHGHPDDIYRFTPPKETDAFNKWKIMSQVEKICWLWNEFYNLIECATENLGQDRFMVLRFEDLFGNIQALKNLFDFLNLKGFSPSRVSEVLKVKRNGTDYLRFPSIRDWSPEFRRIIEQTCTKHALKYGYIKADPAVAGKRLKQPAIHIKKGPDVTIGLPLYSGGMMLSDSVESILSQDYGNFELIISDHGADPFVSEIGRYYQKLDSRVKYIHSGDKLNYIGIHNFARIIELSTTTFFMWGSYDDCLEKSFISSCLRVIKGDDTIALVYPKSKVFNQKGEFLGLGEDSLKADSDDPYDRFIHVIRELQMCNAFYGLFRRYYMRKTHSLRKKCYAHDNLFLAEIALLGKIIQIDDVLFRRRLTRNYNLSMDEHHADVIRSLDPIYLEEGLTLPFCRFTYAHCELINHSLLPPDRKESLTVEILCCFRRRWAIQLNYEINRLIHFLKNGVYYRTWDGRTYNHDLRKQTPNLHYFLVTDVLKSIREALFIFPENKDLKDIYESSVNDIIIFSDSADISPPACQEVTR